MTSPYRQPEPHPPEKRMSVLDALHFAVDGRDIEWILDHADVESALNYTDFVIYMRSRNSLANPSDTTEDV